MRRVVFNQKGGVGKSTITCNLAAVSAQQGLRTLVLDLDVQGNSTRYLLGEGAESVDGGTVADFFQQTLGFSFNPKQAGEFIYETPFERLHLMPSSPALDELHGKLESRYKIYKLREALESLSKDYDAIWIDTPPALNFYTRSALIAAERCLIPFDCDAFSRSALYSLLESVQEVKEDHNPELAVEGIVVNQYQARANLPKQLVEELVAEGHPVLEPFLRSSVKVRESHQAGRPLVHLAPGHKLTLEFQALHARLQKAPARTRPPRKRKTSVGK